MKIDWSKQWDPRIRFFNAVEIDNYEVKHRVGKDSEDQVDNPNYIPDAQLSIRLKGTFKTTMELNDFPFDYQVIPTTPIINVLITVSVIGIDIV